MRSPSTPTAGWSTRNVVERLLLLAANGAVDTNGSTTDMRLPVGTLLQPTRTTAVTVGGNLPADTTSTSPVVTSITSYDQQGNPHTFSVSFTKVSATSWRATLSDGTTTSAPQPIAFAANGSTPNPTAVTFNGITVDLSGITSFAGAATATAQTQNGSAMGSLQSFTISPAGVLVGVFSNGLQQPLGQIALATFNNPPGLEKAGDSHYRSTTNSGAVQIGAAAGGGRGELQSGVLEMSNVDLAQEFTNLVIAQRGFQANSKVISTSDELLQDLVNLKR